MRGNGIVSQNDDKQKASPAPKMLGAGGDGGPERDPVLRGAFSASSLGGRHWRERLPLNAKGEARGLEHRDRGRRGLGTEVRVH